MVSTRITSPKNTGPIKPVPKPAPKPTPATPAPPPPAVPVDQLGGDQQDAYNFILNQMLRPYGLEGLAPELKRLIVQGYTGENLGYMLQETAQYKERFKANDARRKAGLPALSPGEYIATERSYRQIMASAGMPEGFYDSPDDFVGWLSTDVSPAEVKTRVDLATDATQQLDDGTKKAFFDFYGIGPNQIAAFFLDGERALPLLQRSADTVKMGGAANQQGMAVGKDRAWELATSPMAQQADAAWGQVATNWASGERLSQIYGADYTQKDAEDETFFGTASARRKRTQLAEAEVNTFSGNGGGTRGLSGDSGSY